MVTPEHTISYSYNADRLRTQKVVDGVQWEYVWDGDKLIYMYDGTAEWRFIYDAGGSIVGFMNGSSTYYYKKNLQGDVISIFDNNFNEVVTYEYDSWGNLINQGGSKAAAYVKLGKDNPIRYRGYFYDTDTRFYYLQSRYYNAQWGRFVNADGMVSTGQGLIGDNMFAYCNNNPIGRSDSNGYMSTAQLAQNGARAIYYAMAASSLLAFLPGVGWTALVAGTYALSIYYAKGKKLYVDPKATRYPKDVTLNFLMARNEMYIG